MLPSESGFIIHTKGIFGSRITEEKVFRHENLQRLKTDKVKIQKYPLSCRYYNYTRMENTTITNPQEWFESRSYLNGLNIVPHESTDVTEFARQYAANQKQWDEAFAYLKNTDLNTLEAGRHTLEGSELYIAVSESENKELKDAHWESHRKAIDIQYVIAGAEQMGVTPLSKTKVTVPYDDAKDVAFYDAEGPVYLATPEKFFLFFPNDAHQPMIKADGVWGSKKIVIKLFYKS